MNEPTRPINFLRDSTVQTFAASDVKTIHRNEKPSVFTRPGRSGAHYRADIDGLRAIAVISVILVHAGVRAISGGFLGVDVFFVISGYLVHQQVTSRLEKQSFSLFGFYGRRVRRTFPALYLIAVLSLIAGAILLMPGDFKELAHSAITAALGASNIWFASTADYFDHSALTKPLLHSWSLGVEEQYYLIAPLIPFFISRFSANLRRGILIGLIVADLVFCIVVQQLIPQITFFMMPPRLWEFFLGSLVAEALTLSFKRQWIADLLGGAALSALLLSMLLVTDGAAHPGLVTLIPCTATAILIYLGGTTPSFVNRLLGLAPLAFCGLISYSLYLWHWPLIVYARYADLAFDVPTIIIGSLLLVALSVLSWRYVETPFRDPASPLKRHALAILLCGFAVIATSSGIVIAGNGFSNRFSPEVAAVTSYYDYAGRRDYRDGTCFITSKYNSAHYFDRATCLHMSATKPNYLLIGDSHGAHFWAGLSRVFPKINVLQATASGCKPLLDTQGLQYCLDIMHETFVDFLPKAKLDGIIFSAAWNDPDIEPLKATIAYARRYVPKVIVLGDVPGYEVDLPNLLGRSLVERRPELVARQVSTYPWIANVEYKAVFGPDEYISLVDLLCPEHRCIVYAGKDIPLQFDTSHLTTEGSVLIAQMLAKLPIFAPLVTGEKQVKP